MGKATFTNTHDWVSFRASFADGAKVNVGWSRNGDKVEIQDDAARSLQLSYILLDAKKDAGPGKRMADLVEIGERMKAAAGRSATIDDFLGNLRTELGVKGEVPKGRNAATAPSATQATLSPSRGGHLLKAAFPNGDTVELKLNPSSIGLAMDPDVPALSNDLMKFAFGIKQSGMVPPPEFANILLEVARTSGGAAEWLENVKAEIRHGRRPGP